MAGQVWVVSVYSPTLTVCVARKLVRAVANVGSESTHIFTTNTNPSKFQQRPPQFRAPERLETGSCGDSYGGVFLEIFEFLDLLDIFAFFVFCFGNFGIFGIVGKFWNFTVCHKKKRRSYLQGSCLQSSGGSRRTPLPSSLRT